MLVLTGPSPAVPEPVPAAGGSSRAEPKQLCFRLGVSTGPGAGPGGAAQQISDTLGRLVAGAGICEQVPHSNQLCGISLPLYSSLLLLFCAVRSFLPGTAVLGEAVLSLGAFDGTGELETLWDPHPWRWENRSNGKI